MSERTIFLSALEISDPGARAAYLDEQCRGNGELRSQIDALLAANARAGEFLERPAAHGPAFAQTVSLSDRHEDDPAAHQENGDATGIDSDELRHLGPSTRPDALGRLSHYDILTVLGRGAFGTVFKAFDNRLDRIVALKILSPELAASGPARRRFLREAKAAASVRHEHVVDIHAVDEAPTPHLVMECIIGQTLQQKLDKTGPLSVIEILRIGYQIASGLSAAHALGLIHRDIKPANILLENGVERVKITDFGLARAGDDASLTQSGIVCGTPMYMAPEQAQADQLDSRADLFSLGSTLYAMCTGHPPFRATTTMAVLKRVVEDVPRPIRDVNPEMPEWLCEIVEKLLAKKPEDRFQTAGEVATLLSQHLTHLQQPATTAQPPRVGRVQPVPEEEESSDAFVYGLLILLPIFSLLLMFDGALRKLISGHVSEAPDDIARLLMMAFGAVALGAFALSRWVGDGGWRRIATGLAGAALLLSIGEGTRLIRVGEGDRPKVAVGPEPVTPLPPPTAVTDAEGWIDLLTSSQAAALANAGEGVTLQGGRLTLSPSGSAPAQLFLNGHPVQNGTVRLKARCLGVRDGFVLGLGMGHNSGTPRRLDAALHGPFAISPARLHLWQYEESFQTTPLTDAEAFVVKEGTEIDLEFQRTGSQLRARLGTLEIATTAGLRDGWDAYPYLGATNSKWLITEWKFRPNAVTGSDSPLLQVDLKSWGRFVDPSGVGSLERDSHLVNVGVPGTQAMNLLPLPGYNVDAPRLVQHVTGDFEIAVAVPPYERPKPGTDLRPGGQVSYRDAGLLVWQDDKTLFRFSRSGLGESYDGAPYLHAEWYGAGASLGDEREMLPQFPDNPTHLKIVRRGDRLILSHGVDGESWTVWQTVSNLKLAPSVQIGVMIQNSTRSGFKARFETLRVRATELPDPTLARIPFDPGRASQWQEDASTAAGVPVERTNALGMTLRLIPPGEFTMGMSIDEINDVLKRPHQAGLDQGLLEFTTHSGGPQHTVRLTQPYYLGTTEVTVGQFRQFLKESGYQPTGISEKEGDIPTWFKPATKPTDEAKASDDAKNNAAEIASQPATSVTWHEARRFCKWLSEKEGVEYTLPTEAQWEFACRAGVAEHWSHGDDRTELADYASFDLGYHDAPPPVARKKPNAFGLFDMHGSAHEWALDWHQRDYFSKSPLVDPLCTTPGVGRVCRGGWWWDSADLIRSSSRSYNIPDVRYPGCGFRVAIVGDLTPLKTKSRPQTDTLALAPPLDFFGSLLDGGSGVFALEAADDGKRLVTGHYTGKLCVWDVESRREVQVIDAHESAVHGLVLLPDRKHAISSAEDGTLRMHDLDTGGWVREFVGHTGRVDALCLADEGRNLVSATADFEKKKDFGLRSWRIESGQELKHAAGEVGFIGGMTSVQNGKRLVTADFMHQKLTLWDADMLDPLQSAPQGSLFCIATSGNGRQFATGHAARTVAEGVWDDPENCVVRLWNAETLQVEKQLVGHRSPVAGVALSPDGRWLVSVSGGAHGPEGRYLDGADSSIRLWDVRTAKQIGEATSDDRLLRVRFLPDGQHFVTGGNQHLRLWSVPEVRRSAP